MSIEEKTPVYEGAKFKAPEVQIATSLPKYEPAGTKPGQQADAALQQLRVGLGDLAKLKDFQSGQELKRGLSENEAGLLNDLHEAAQVTAGEDGSLYMADGKLNESFFQAKLSEYQQKNNALPRSFYLQDATVRGEQDVLNANSGMKIAAVKLVAQQEVGRIAGAYKDRLSYMQATGDFEGWRQTAADGHAAGVTSEYQFNEEVYNSQQAEMLSNAQQMFRDDPDALIDAYDSGAFDGASQSTRGKIEHLLDNVYTQERPGVMRRKSDGSLAKDAPEAPYNLPSSMVKLWYDWEGAFKDNADAQRAAMPIASAWARSQITKPDDEQEEATVKAVFKAYGLSDDYANGIIKHLRDEIDGRVYKPEGAFKRIEPGMFFTPANRETYNGWRKTQATLRGMSDAQLKEDSGVKDANGDAITNKELLRRVNAQVERWNTYDRQERERAESIIDGKFQEWRVRNPNASYREQARQYWSIVGDYRKTFAPKENIEDWEVVKQEEELAGAYDSKLARARNEREAEARRNDEDVKRTNEARGVAGGAKGKPIAAAEPVALSLSTSGRDSLSLPKNKEESILYVGADSGVTDGSVIAVHRGNVTSMARVQHVKGLDGAVMSQKLRRNVGALTGKFDSIDIKGNDASISAQQGAPTSSRRVVATGIPEWLDDGREMPEVNYLFPEEGEIDDGLVPAEDGDVETATDENGRERLLKSKRTDKGEEFRKRRREMQGE